MFKRARYVLHSISEFFARFEYSLWTMCLVAIVQIMAKIDREVLKEYAGRDIAYFYSIARKWLNDSVGYYLVMAVLVLVMLWILLNEYKDFPRKTPQELD